MLVSRHFASSQWSLIFSMLYFREGCGDHGGGLGFGGGVLGDGQKGKGLRVRCCLVSGKKAELIALTIQNP